MARTPLFHTLQRLLTDARLARAHRVPLHAIQEWRAAAQERAQAAPAPSPHAVTRRAFLAGTGALAALLAPPRWARAATDQRIVIVGGGIAGLTCALTLADAGIAATISLPHHSPFFRSAYVFYRVGQYTRFAGMEKARQGGVLFCGEHTSLAFQGFMEGGASEGVRAAQQLMRLLPGE